MKIHSYNEWDKLRTVIVGDATKANWPNNDPVFSKESEKTNWKETPVPSGPVPNWIINEANEDLQALADTFKSLGVQVIRPDVLDFQSLDGMYNYCPRDRLIVHGSTVIDPAMMYPCRDMEIKCYNSVLTQAERVLTMPRNQGMILDAANVLRMGKKWLFLESASGNRQAYQWLCNQLPEIEIELVNFYAGVHIDSTISVLRPGFVVVNGSRVTPQNIPQAFDGWTIYYVNQVHEQKFYQYPYASKWIGLNMLSVDPNTVIVDQNQTQIIDDLTKFGFTVIPLELRHARTLGGGFHCVTLDIHRQS